jgi:hypothetical protein
MSASGIEKILKAIPPVLTEVKSWTIGSETYVVIPIKIWGALEAAYEDEFGQLPLGEVRNEAFSGNTREQDS